MKLLLSNPEKMKQQNSSLIKCAEKMLKKSQRGNIF